MFFRQIMRKEIKEQLPKWYNDTKDYGLILTDDLDSLLSCAVIQTIKPNWKIEQIMIFKGNKKRYDRGEDALLKDFLGVTDNNIHECIGVDLALQHGKCFDNHLSRISSTDAINNEAINFNNIHGITKDNYHKKYCSSTVLLVWSLYDLPKESLSDELMMLLLAIDGTYTGYFNCNGRFAYLTEKCLVEYLDLPEFYECLKRHTREEFEQIKSKYNLDAKVKLHRGYVETDINIEAINELLAKHTNVHISIPTDKFRLHKTFVDIATPFTDLVRSTKEIVENPYCLALTRKNYMNYSVEIEN